MATKLEIKRQLAVRFPADYRIGIIVIGIGGTGSALALSLARLVYHARRRGYDVDLTFMDGDVVEERNVGRQYFAPCDVVRNKAEVMAEWLNQDWGLEIAAKKSFVDGETYLNHVMPQDFLFLIGCVDNAEARRQIARLVKKSHKRWWIDSGNDRYNGQVLVGNVGKGKISDDSVWPGMGLTNSVPAPNLQAPEILKDLVPTPNEVGNGDPSCADLVATDDQGLHINQQMAVIVVQYLYNIVIRRELRTMATYVSLDPPAIRNTPITAETLSPFMCDESVSV